MERREVKLGNKAKDAASGFTGIVTEMLIQRNGNIMFGICPESKEGNQKPDPLFFDWNLVDFVDEGLADRVPEFKHDNLHEIGDKVKDEISGYSGEITSKCYYVNGCVLYGVTGEYNREKDKNPHLYFDGDRLKSVKKAKPEEQAPQRKTGGPSFSRSSMQQG